MFKRVRVGGVAALLCLLIATPAAAGGPPVMHGNAAVLMDGRTGQVLYEYNAHQKRYPASTTKLLTALVAAERGKLDQVITVSDKAVDQVWDSASCYISQGEQQPLKYLLYGLMLSSGNDCADAIAEGVAGGNYAQFIDWMNETAKRVGATQSHFSNPHGLHAPDHYTTALDLALIGRAALGNPTVRYFASKTHFDWPGKEAGGTYYNSNRLLFTYEGSTGGKTGFTDEARFTLVHAAERNGLYLVGVVMGVDFAGNRDRDMAGLLDYGFDEFTPVEVVAGGTFFGAVPVSEGEAASVRAVAKSGFQATARKGGQPAVKVVPKLAESVKAPVEPGQQVGVLEVLEGDRVLEQIPLVAEAGVEAKSQVAEQVVGGLLSTLKWIAYIVGGLLIFRTVVKTTRRILRRRRGQGGAFSRRPSRGNTGSISFYRSR